MENIKKELGSLISGLLYYSESEYPLEWLDWGSQKPDQIKATIIARHPAGSPVEQVSTDDFFHKIIRNMNNSGDASMTAVGGRYKMLHDFIRANSSSTSVWRCGKIEIGIYVVMNTRDGHCFVLHTTSIET